MACRRNHSSLERIFSALSQADSMVTSIATKRFLILSEDCSLLFISEINLLYHICPKCNLSK